MWPVKFSQNLVKILRNRRSDFLKGVNFAKSKFQKVELGRMSISTLHVNLMHRHDHVYAACPCLYSMSVSMLYIHVNAACPYPCYISMFMLKTYVCAACRCLFWIRLDVHDHAESPCPWCMFMSILHLYVLAACPCPCCMPMSTVHVHVSKLYVHAMYRLHVHVV